MERNSNGEKKGLSIYETSRTEDDVFLELTKAIFASKRGCLRMKMMQKKAKVRERERGMRPMETERQDYVVGTLDPAKPEDMCPGLLCL